MKILIITPSYKPAYIYGGPIFSVAYLAEELSKQHEVLVICTTANGKEELQFKDQELNSIDGVNVTFFKRQTKDHSHLSFGLLKYLWKHGNEYDVIHIQSWWNLVAIFSALICKIKSWKYIITPRGMLSPYTYQSSLLKKIIHLFLGNFLLKSTKVHTTSSDESVKIEALNSKYHTVVIPNFVSLDSPVLKRNTNQITQLLFLSRIHPKKGLDILLKSLPLLKFEFHLNIAGDGDSAYINSLKQLAKNLGIENKITWLGSVYGNDKFELYANSDFMILPSHDENFANNVLETLLVGTPVIVTENVGLATFVYQNNLGYVYKGGEMQLAACLNNAIEKTDYLQNIHDNARALVLKEFNNTKLLEEYVSLYRKTQ